MWVCVTGPVGGEVTTADGPVVQTRNAVLIDAPAYRARSKRSRFITLSHAATKSRTNPGSASSQA